MADRIITAEARITATDATGAVFANIGKKIDAIGKAAKISPSIDAMAKSLERAQAQMRAYDAVSNQRGAFGAARLKFNETQKAVEQAARAMKAAEGPSRALTTSYDRAARAVSSASAAFEKQKASMVSAIRAAESFGAPISKMAAEQTRLKAVVSSTTAAIEKQVAAERQAARAQEQVSRAVPRGGRAARGGHGDSTLAGLAGIYAGHEVGHFARNVIERYQDFDRESRYARVVMGLTEEQQRPLLQQALHGGATSRFNDVQWVESQRELAARGYDKDQVMAFTPYAAQLGQAFDKTMPEGVKALEGALLGFKKDTSTFEAARASAQRTVDLQVKASKISGMDYDDIIASYKFGAAPAQMAHLSEEQLLAFSAIGKKANMGGDETGVAFRALAKNLLTPTGGAQIAMRAAGIDYNSYQKMPDRLDTQGFVGEVAKKFGVKLDGKAQGALENIFSNKALIGDATAFMPAVREALSAALGGDDAKSKGKIAGLARNYRDASATAVDSNGLMTAIMTAISKNPALANSIFGSKQGGRIFAALGDPRLFAHVLDELRNKSQGFGGKVSDARMEGFNGAVQKLEGTIATLETAMGRSLDAGGRGGLLTDGTNAIAGLLQAFAEATPQVHQLAAAGGVAAAAWGAIKGFDLFKGGFGLNATAGHLDEAAMQLKGAAAQLAGGGHGGPGGSAPGGGGLPGEPGKGPGASPQMTSLWPRFFTMLGGALPIIIDAYDDITHPKDREERYKKQQEGAAETRETINRLLGRAFGYLGFGDAFPVNKPMDPKEQGPRLPMPLYEPDPIRRAIERMRITDPGADPWLGGERQAIERRSLIAADNFKRDPEAARGRAMMASEGPIDVTGKVGVEGTFNGNLNVSFAPSQWLVAKIEHLGQMFSLNGTPTPATAALSSGSTMPKAGQTPRGST